MVFDNMVSKESQDPAKREAQEAIAAAQSLCELSELKLQHGPVTRQRQLAYELDHRTGEGLEPSGCVLQATVTVESDRSESGTILLCSENGTVVSPIVKIECTRQEMTVKPYRDLKSMREALGQQIPQGVVVHKMLLKIRAAVGSGDSADAKIADAISRGGGYAIDSTPRRRSLFMDLVHEATAEGTLTERWQGHANDEYDAFVTVRRGAQERVDTFVGIQSGLRADFMRIVRRADGMLGLDARQCSLYGPLWDMERVLVNGGIAVDKWPMADKDKIIDITNRLRNPGPATRPGMY